MNMNVNITIRKILYTTRRFANIRRRLCSNADNNIFIASAVRTPITRIHGDLAALTSPQLAAIVIEAAYKQAGIPAKDIKEIHLGKAFWRDGDDDITEILKQAATLAELHKQISCIPVSKGLVTGLKAIVQTARRIRDNCVDSAIAGGIESMSTFTNEQVAQLGKEFDCSQHSQDDHQKYIRTTHARAIQALEMGVFDGEVVAVRVRTSGKPITFVEQDENLQSDPCHSEQLLYDGASALLLTNSDVITNLNVKPLARILSYVDKPLTDEVPLDAYISGAKEVLEIAKVSSESVSMWEVQEINSTLPSAFAEKMCLPPAQVNSHGGDSALGLPAGMSASRLVTHLAHSLRPGSIGCAVAGDRHGVAAVLIEKLSASISNKLPTLTLFTKDPCPLCDILMEDLETHFAGEYQLEKIYIDQKENVRFLRLYRHDIPVLFLNGQFLCMHKLNKRLLGHKLREIS